MDTRRVNAGLLGAFGALWLLTLADDVGPNAGLVTWGFVLIGVVLLLAGIVAIVRPTALYSDVPPRSSTALLALFCLMLLLVLLA